MRQQFEVDDWEVCPPTIFLKHGMCSRIYTQDIPCRMPQMQPSGNSRQTNCCGQPMVSPGYAVQFLPILLEIHSIISVRIGHSMHFCTPVSVEIGSRLYQPIQLVRYLAIAHNYHSNTAHAVAVLVGCLKVNCCKLFIFENLFC